MVTVDDIRAAAARLDGVANRTPVITSRTLDERLGAAAFCKAESFQRIGSFKFRGAYNALASLDDAARSRGVLTYSSGNHAQAIALASRLLGIDATIVMPTDAPSVKLAATRGYLDGTGGRVVEYDRDQTTREAVGARIASERGLTIIPPYDNLDVIAGQGTVALELFEEVGTLDHLFVCCGGGGLLSGCATVAKALSPGCRVIGVEPEAGDDATRSFRTGTLQTVENPTTIADGARTPFLGDHTFPIVLERVDDMMTVTDRQLVDAMRFTMERMKLVVEPTGVLALAGAMERADALSGRIGIVISGGNVDLGGLPTLFSMLDTEGC